MSNCQICNKITNIMNKNEKKFTEEKEFLDKFLNTKIGKKWYIENFIIQIIKHETPDFLLKNNDNETIALEITQFIAENKNLHYSQALTRIGNQLCEETKEKYNIKISILIDRYDKRKFSPNWNEHIDYAYNPGFSKLPSKNIFKNKLREILNKNINKLEKGILVQEWIQVGSDHYKISVHSFPSIISRKYDCHVNNAGQVKFNPFDELQNCINKKNKKVSQYRKNNKCYLLIIVPDSKVGNYCTFTDELLNYKFISDFDLIFLYEEKTNISYILNT